MSSLDPAAAAPPDAAVAAAAPPAVENLAAAVQRFGLARVLVVGDAMLDRYIFGRVGRISPEAPVPVLIIAREVDEPGGAGNVVHNLHALGAAAAFVSVVGDDPTGSELTGLIGGQPGVEPWLLVERGRTTPLKTRFIAIGNREGGQQLLRADREDTTPIQPRLAERLLRIAHDVMAATSVVVLSDYRKGVLAGDVPARLIAAAHAIRRRVIVDLRAHDFARFAGADVIVPHARDIVPNGEPDDLEQGDVAVAAAAHALRAAHGFGAVLVKRGEVGFTLADAEGTRHYPLDAARLVDLSGAGDASVATFAAAIASGASLRLASALAAVAAQVVGDAPGSAVIKAQALAAAVSAT
jgi:D-beta-D-heptose 7-phosphate kinase/D-beta-D-heptose 1-phosphate adenosyltransferase